MASFSEDGVEVHTLSETNSVNYKIDVKATDWKGDGTRYGNRVITLNDVDINQNNQERGLAVLVLNGDTNVKEAHRVFDTYSDPNAMGAVITYISDIVVNKIVIICSYDAIKTSIELTNYMHSIGSCVWPSVAHVSKGTNYRFSYAAIMNTNMGKIVSESFTPAESFGGSNGFAQVSVVYDTINDLGACGVSRSVVNEIGERLSPGNEYNFTDYVDDTLTNLNLKVGITLYVKCETFTSKEAFDAQNRSRLYVEQYNDRAYVSGNNYGDNSKPDTWETKEGYIDILPNTNVTKITVVGYQYDLSGNKVYKGQVGIRNVHVTQVSRKESSTRSIVLGVNGIRNRSITDNDSYSNPVMKLLNIESNNTISGFNISEFINAP